jgi:hypothetical protein
MELDYFKALADDNIFAKLMKYGGFAMLGGIASINRNNIGEIMPEKWRTEIICSFHKN